VIRAPVHSGSYTFYAHVEFLENADLRNLSKEDLLARVPADDNHSFLIAVDSTAIAHPDFPIMVIDVRAVRGRRFRAIAAEIQAIENNLSIANMDFFEFAGSVDKEGIFRGLRKP